MLKNKINNNKKEQKLKKLIPKAKKNNTEFIVNIKGTINNMIFSLTALNGNTIYNTSCGAWNFAGSKKASAFATTDTAQKFIDWLNNVGVKKVHTVITGFRRSSTKPVIKMLSQSFQILSLHYPNEKPHNGCRKRKMSRS